MSVVVYNGNSDKKYTVLTKGAPETMKFLFQSNTVPDDYDDKVT